ncbi:MAG: hypothetical protein AAB431_02425 [Patescibacteria group bacterium]
MMLFLCAQDLQQLWIGLLNEETFHVIERKDIFPEGYLNEIDLFLKRNEIRLEDLTGLSIVTGPGSFTASRISLTIANTLHFTHKLPLFVLKNEENLSPIELISKFGVGQKVEEEEYAHAFYNRPPHITSPFGDKPLDATA